METLEQTRQLDLNTETRNKMLNEHPIVIRDYTVLTPMIRATYDLVRQRVWARRTGVFLYAKPRMGKTRCARAVERILSQEFEKAYFLHYSADQRRTHSDTGLLFDLLESDGLKLTKRSTYKEMLSRLLVHIQTQVASLSGNQFVLMIDEMQMLSEPDLRVLLVLHNRLESAGVSMTTLGFAQPEILHLRSALITTKAYNLIARFLSEPIPFDGCGKRDDLETILGAYDGEKRFPENSDWTYTRFFLPQAFESGFRLEKFNNEIWAMLSEAARPLGTGTVPMEHLTQTIEYLLLANREKDEPHFELDEEMISAAIDASNLRHFSSLMAQ